MHPCKECFATFLEHVDRFRLFTLGSSFHGIGRQRDGEHDASISDVKSLAPRFEPHEEVEEVADVDAAVGGACA